jgi:hypothetical protein
MPLLAQSHNNQQLRAQIASFERKIRRGRVAETPALSHGPPPRTPPEQETQAAQLRFVDGLRVYFEKYMRQLGGAGPPDNG